MTTRYLLQIQENYTFEILRPLQQVMREQGHSVAWLALGNKVNMALFNDDDVVLSDIAAAVSFNPAAVFVTGNVVPDFLPGLKVQLFHGFEWKKKGHFKIRGSFDLYCTQGPFFTRKFTEFAQQHGYFDVMETGWPKLDNIFPMTEQPHLDGHDDAVHHILYAPTFSPKLTSAAHLYDAIRATATNQQDSQQWHIKFHPKMAKSLITQYQDLAAEQHNITFHGAGDILPLINKVDVLISDTSSVIAEALLLETPVITFANALPDPYINDFTDAHALADTLSHVLTDQAKQQAMMQDYATEFHPYKDGHSAQRVLAATEQVLTDGLQATKRKPSNWLRNLKLRKQNQYWPWRRA